MSITIHVKATNGDKHAVGTEKTALVSEFKDAIAEKTSIPANQQRLIYKGSVLKDDRSLESYGVDDGQTVILVRGTGVPGGSPAPQAAASVASPAPSTTAAPTSTGAPAPGAAQAPAAAPNPFGALFGTGTVPGTNTPFTSLGVGGNTMYQMQQMQQQMMQNPQYMEQMMNSPLMQSLLDNPALMQSMLQGNPAIQSMMQSNPEVAQMLNDPALLRQSMEMARNPRLMNEMMRNSDRALSNIEAMPGGFNALQQMYTNVQEPMNNAVLNANQTNSDLNQAAPTNTNTAPSAPLPNPWGAPAARPNTGAINNPFVPNLGGDMGMGLGGMGMGGMGMGGDLGAQMQMMQGMMQNPMMRQMMESMMSNPQMLQQVMAMNPMMAQMSQSNPMVAQMMSNPEIMRSAMQMMFGPAPAAGAAATAPAANPFANFAAFMPPAATSPATNPPAATSPDAAATAPPAAGQPAVQPQFNMAAMLQGMMGQQPQQGAAANPMANPFAAMMMNPMAFAPAQPAQQPEVTYATQLRQLQDMGFYDAQANIRALVATGGDVNSAVAILLG